MFFNRDDAGSTIVAVPSVSRQLCGLLMTLAVIPLAVVDAGNYAHHHDADAARVAGGGKDDGPIVPPAIETPKA